MKIIDGKSTSLEIQQELYDQVLLIKENGGKVPHLAAVSGLGMMVLVKHMLNAKVKACQRVGFESSLIQLETSISEKRFTCRNSKIK